MDLIPKCHLPLMGCQSSKKLHNNLQATMFLKLLMIVDWNKISNQLVTLQTSKYALDITTSGKILVILSKLGTHNNLN